jgi:HAD superfamily hydrolase (TIGR01509 family)
MCAGAAPLVLLDIGGTLVSGPAGGPAGRIARALGLDAAQRRILAETLMTSAFDGPAAVARFLAQAFGVPRDAAAETAAGIWHAQEGEARPWPGARDAVQGLREAGLRLAVVSNIWPPYLTATRHHYADLLDDWIPRERQFYSFREGRAKPAPELFRAALAAAGAPAHRCVMVGDSYRADIEPAMALGMRTVWLLHEPLKQAAHIARVLNHEAAGPSVALTSIAELSPDTISSALETRPDGGGRLPDQALETVQ